MPTCALCDNAQPVGESCEVCGHPFPPGEAIPVPVEPVEGLEPTVMERLPPGAGDGPPLEGLEPNAGAPVEVPAAVEVVDGLELTSLPPVEIVPDPTPDLESSTAEGVPGPELPEPESRACRYCRTPATGEEVFCLRCGMRLPWRDVAEGRLDAPPARACRSCGTPATTAVCRACGARVPG